MEWIVKHHLQLHHQPKPLQKTQPKPLQKTQHQAQIQYIVGEFLKMLTKLYVVVIVHVNFPFINRYKLVEKSKKLIVLVSM